MTHGEFTGVTFNDLDPPGTRISRSSEFSVVNSTEITLNISHRTHIFTRTSTSASITSNLHGKRAASLRKQVPIGYNSAPQNSPPKIPLTWTDPKTQLLASFLYSSGIRCQTAPGSDPPFFHNALDRPTHRQTDRQTDRRTDRQIVHRKV